jgi:hypothetical protein
MEESVTDCGATAAFTVAAVAAAAFITTAGTAAAVRVKRFPIYIVYWN